MFVSESKTATQQIADTISESLSLVTLTPEQEAQMAGMYLTRKDRKSFETLGVFATATVTRLTMAFDFIGYLLAYADTVEDQMEADEASILARFQSMFDQYANTVAILESGKLPKELKASLAESLTNVRGAIIRKSTRFEGGMDILHTGTPAAESPLAAAGNFDFFQGSPSRARAEMSVGESFAATNTRMYQTEVSKGAIRAAKSLQDAVFGNQRNAGNVFANEVKNIDLDFNWESLNNVLYSIHPSFTRLNISLFKNLDKGAVSLLKDFLSVGIKRMPSGRMIEAKKSQLRYNTDPAIYNEVVLATDLAFEAAIVLSLRPEFVKYITQGAEQKTQSLYRWYQSWGGYFMRVSGGARGSIRKLSAVPRYVTSATRLPDLRKLREKFGYNISDGDADENGLTVMPNGLPAVLPNRADIDVKFVGEYETELNDIQESLFSRGIPLSVTHDTLRTSFYQCQTENLDIDQEVQKEAKSLSRFGNACIGVDPNFHVVVTTDSTGLSVNSTRTIGAKRPQTLDLADSLGFDFSQPGEAANYRTGQQFLTDLFDSTSGHATYKEAIQLMLRAAQLEAGSGKFIAASDGKTLAYTQPDASDAIYRLLSEMCCAYGFMVGNGRAAKPEALVKQAAEALGYGEDINLAETTYDKNIYNGLIEDNCTVEQAVAAEPALWALRICIRVLNDAAGMRGSNLMSSLIQEMGSVDSAAEAMDSHTHAFNLATKCPLADMARLNNYLGGAVLTQMSEALLGVNRRELYSDISKNSDAPPARQLQQHILPLATMITKVIPNSLEIFEGAEAEQDRIRRDETITAEDIQFPGLKEGVALLPHQLIAHQYLRKRPRYAVLFISPGGGKTILGLTDIGCLIKELDDLGEDTIRPLIVCPTNLVTTWADDLTKISNGWNVIPITADTVNTWGEDKMYEVLHNAPRNTIFVTGLSFLSTGTFNVDVGGVRVQIRGAVEFINRFNFSYVLLDESHKVKNYQGGQVGSQVHFNAKLLFTAPSVRYARIATGTLVTDRVTDVVGQAALLSPAIFGDNLNIVDQGDGQLAMIRRAHSRISNHTAFINLKRKAWAFMLPNPVDTFISVEINDPSVPNSELHQETYQAMYQQIMEALDEAAKKAKASAEDDEEEGPDGGNDMGIDEDEMEEGDILGKLLASDANLQIYFQRMEMLLTDPMGDDIARTTFEAAGVHEFTSAKVLEVIKRIKKHFEVQQQRDPEVSEHQIFVWQPGVTPREFDIAIYDGKKYMARKQTDDFKRAVLPPSTITPDLDTDYWKPEKQGKLIVFTRYTRSANAVYNALPEEYKRTALLFHGEVGKMGQNKEANLDSFKTDDRYQILIANEQAISEGHNLQMGSRIIRVDTPWSPGTYDQSTARIFRPDVSAAKFDESGRPGDMDRELVFIDWIMTSGTLEVGKVARLMWKTVEKTQFDEKGNERYEALDEYELQPIRMSPSLLLDSNTIDDFLDYFRAKRDMNEIESREFAEMRATTAAEMIPLTPAAPLRDFRVLPATPLVANQKIADPNNWGITRLLDWTRDNKYESGETLKDALHRYPVVTEFGNGMIVGLTVRNVDGKLREDAPISTVRVRLSGSEELVTIPATKIHLATKVSKADLAKFFAVNKTWATETERKRATKAAEEVAEAEVIQDTRNTEDTGKTIAKTVSVAREEARAAKRKKNVAEKRPVNEGVAEAAKTAGAKRVRALGKVSGAVRKVIALDTIDLKDDPTPDKEQMEFTLTPLIYNGFIALEAAVANPDAKELKALEFVHFGDYAYIDILYYSDLEKFLDFIEDTKKLEFDNATAKRLEFIMDGFDGSGKMTFNSRQALKLDSDLKQFFLVRHRTGKDRKHIKVYPQVMPDRLRLMIDIATNPKAKSFVGIKVPGTRKWGKFEYSEGQWVTFTKTITSAKARINRIVKAGYKVTNLKAAVNGLTKIKGTKRKAD